MNVEEVCQSVEAFNNLTIMVVGDVILDAYYKGDVKRISPEAPVPVLEVNSKEYRLGGAANVALNILGLGATPIICSVIGEDENAKSLKDIMSSEGLVSDGLISSNERVTSKKTRLVSGFSQMTRFDEEITTALNSVDENALIERVKEIIDESSPEALIFQDYDKGAITPRVIKEITEHCHGRNVKITVDPKHRNFFSYAGATMFKPNLKELRDGLNLQQIEPNEKSLNHAFNLLKERMPVEIGFFTLSADGVFITDGVNSHHLPAMKRNIADVSGAGDTVIATATCALAQGLDMMDVAKISNLAGGWVCQFPGVVSIKQEQLNEEIRKAF